MTMMSIIVMMKMTMTMMSIIVMMKMTMMTMKLVMMMEEHFEDKELISQTIHSRPNRLKASLAVAQI